MIKGRRIVGTWGGEAVPDRDIPRYAARFLDGSLPLAALISHEYPLDRINDALDDLEQGRVSRALVSMGR